MEKPEVIKLRDLTHLIRRNIDVKGNLPKIYNNFTQMQIIFYLSINKDKVIYQKDICDELNLRKSSITETLDYLESIDVIKRIVDEKDARKKKVILSNAAEEYEEAIKDNVKKINKQALEGICEEDIKVFNKVMEKMQENLTI